MLILSQDTLEYIDVLKRNVEEMRWSIRVPQPLNDRRLCYFSLVWMYDQLPNAF